MRMDSGDSTSNAYGAMVESAFHIFKECPASRATAFSSMRGAKLDRWPGENIKDLISFCLDPSRYLWEGILDKEAFIVFALSFFYMCWKYRNDKIFTGKLSINMVAAHLDQMDQDMNYMLNFNPSFEETMDGRWEPLPMEA